MNLCRFEQLLGGNSRTPKTILFVIGTISSFFRKYPSVVFCFLSPIPIYTPPNSRSALWWDLFLLQTARSSLSLVSMASTIPQTPYMAHYTDNYSQHCLEDWPRSSRKGLYRKRNFKSKAQRGCPHQWRLQTVRRSCPNVLRPCDDGLWRIRRSSQRFCLPQYPLPEPA